MVAGHLDEIGFIVTKIDNDGFLKFTPIGGWWNQVMLSQKLLSQQTKVRKSEALSVLNHRTYYHLKNVKTIDMKEMFIDGVKSKRSRAIRY